MTRDRAGAHVWRHSAESGALAGVAAVAIAAALPASVPVWMSAAFFFLAGVVVMFSVFEHTGDAPAATYMLAWGWSLGGWMAAARLSGVWHALVLSGIVALVMVMVPLGAVVFGRISRARTVVADKQKKTVSEKELRYWVKLLSDLGVSGVTITGVEKTGAGKKITGQLGKAGPGQPARKFSSLAALTENLVVQLQLPDDAVHFEKGETAADFILHVREKRHSGVTMLPVANLPITITRPIGLGVADDGKEWTELLREIHMLIIGATGSGKSNLLHVLIAQLARCVDCVIFMIDTKGGRTARPWVAPWAKEQCARPVLDWVATTREEAKVMIDALNRGVQARARSGHGGEKIVPDVEMPAMILICDEGAFVFGHGKKETRAGSGDSSAALAAAGQDFVEMARSEAGMGIFAGVRGRVETWGTTGIKTQCRLRIGMAVAEATEGSAVFPDDHRAAQALSRITQPGDCLVLNTAKGRRMSPPVHIYRITDGSVDEDTNEKTEDRITPIALETGDTIRPALDEMTAAAMGKAYDDRWYRQHGRDLVDTWRGAAVASRPVGDPEFDKIVSQLEDPENDIDPRHSRVRQILDERGYQGATVKRLHTQLLTEGSGAARETIHRWLAKDERAVPSLVRRAKGNRWVGSQFGENK